MNIPEENQAKAKREEKDKVPADNKKINTKKFLLSFYKVIKIPLVISIVVAVIGSITTLIIHRMNLNEQRKNNIRAASQILVVERHDFEDQVQPALNYISSFGEDSIPFLFNSMVTIEELVTYAAQRKDIDIEKDSRDIEEIDARISLFVNAIRRIRITNNRDCKPIIDKIWKIIMSTQNHYLRSRLIKDIAYFDDPSYLQKFLPFLKDENNLVRRSALLAYILVQREEAKFTDKDFAVIEHLQINNIPRRLKMNFTNVGIQNARFSNLKFESCNFIVTNLNECSFNGCEIDNGLFEDLQETKNLEFVNVKFKNTTFKNVIFQNSKLGEKISDKTFEKEGYGKVEFTDRCKFLNVDFSSVKDLNMDLYNNFYFDEKSQKSLIGFVRRFPSENNLRFVEYIRKKNKYFD